MTKEERRKYNNDYYHNNKERTAERRSELAKERRKDPEVGEKARAAFRRWYYEHQEEQKEVMKERNNQYYKEDPEKYREKQRTYAKRNPIRMMLQSVKAKCKRKDVFFDLVEEDVKVPEVCPVFGYPFIPAWEGTGTGRPVYNSPSLDRLIPELGYTPDNIRVISFRANTIKRDATLEELQQLAKWLEGELAEEL